MLSNCTNSYTWQKGSDWPKLNSLLVPTIACWSNRGFLTLSLLLPLIIEVGKQQPTSCTTERICSYSCSTFLACQGALPFGNFDINKVVLDLCNHWIQASHQGNALFSVTIWFNKWSNNKFWHWVLLCWVEPNGQSIRISFIQLTDLVCPLVVGVVLNSSIDDRKLSRGVI